VTLVRPASSVSWELRGVWARRKVVRLTLTERCEVPRVIGRVQRVATTGAFAVVDGWHIPIDDILAVGDPLLEEIEAYEAEKREALERGREEGWA
jgi:hypothetical protein